MSTSQATAFQPQGCAPPKSDIGMARVNRAELPWLADPTLLRQHSFASNAISRLNRMPSVSPLTTSPSEGAVSVSLDGCLRQEASETDCKSDSFYTPCSTKSQLAVTFQQYRRPSHPDMIGRPNAYPYHQPIVEDRDTNP